jgi:Zn-dependent protease with chaperone function
MRKKISTTAASKRHAGNRLSPSILNHIRDLQWRANQELFLGHPTIAERLETLAAELAEARQ